MTISLQRVTGNRFFSVHTQLSPAAPQSFSNNYILPKVLHGYLCQILTLHASVMCECVRNADT